MTDITNSVQAYVEAIVADYNAYQDTFNKNVEINEKMKAEFAEATKFTKGKKYIKVVREGGGVHSFIVATDSDAKFKRGDILKAASWSAPARNFARGNVFGDYNVRWSGI